MRYAMEKRRPNSAIEHSTFKSSLSARKSSLTDILKKKINQNRKKKKVQSGKLIYIMQKTQRAKKRMKKLKSKGLNKVFNQIEGTQMEQLENNLSPQVLCDYVVTCVDSYLFKLGLVDVEEGPPAQFAIINPEPLHDRLCEYNLENSTSLCNIKPEKYPLLKLFTNADKSYKGPIAKRPIAWQDLRQFLLVCICHAFAFYGVFKFFFPTPRPVSNWEWFLSKLNYYLQKFLYLDVKSV